LEAGHRVSYASLRALAAAFDIDVDSLERELYAVRNSTDDFVEIPRWVRVLSGRRWFGGPGLSRRDVLLIEAFCVMCAVVALSASFLVTGNARVPLARITAFAFGCCYLTAGNIRLMDRYRLWPDSENAPPGSPRTWRTITAEYVFMLGVALLGIAALWLVVV
jgi:hypothetical protein